MIPIPAILSLLKGSPAMRKAVYVSIALSALLITGTVFRNSAWDAGYSQAQREIQAATAAATAQLISDAKVEWERASSAAETQISVEAKIIERIRYVEKEIPVIIEGVPVTCRDVGPTVLRLFNGAIVSANNHPETSAEPGKEVH